jgi:hypothetical protein
MLRALRCFSSQFIIVLFILLSTEAQGKMFSASAGFQAYSMMYRYRLTELVVVVLATGYTVGLSRILRSYRTTVVEKL